MSDRSKSVNCTKWGLFGILILALALILVSSGMTARQAMLDRHLLDAAMYGDTKRVPRELANGAHINTRNADGWTPLIMASHMMRWDTVQALINAHADVNIADRKGRTVLMDCALEGDVNLVRALLRADANVNSHDAEGNTALMCGVGSRNLTVVQILLDAGADPTPRTKHGRTAAEMASKDKLRDAYQLIMSHQH